MNYANTILTKTMTTAARDDDGFDYYAPQSSPQMVGEIEQGREKWIARVQRDKTAEARHDGEMSSARDVYDVFVVTPTGGLPISQATLKFLRSSGTFQGREDPTGANSVPVSHRRYVSRWCGIDLSSEQCCRVVSLCVLSALMIAGSYALLNENRVPDGMFTSEL